MLEQDGMPQIRDASHASMGFERRREGDAGPGAPELDDNHPKQESFRIRKANQRGNHVQTELRGARPDIASPLPTPRRRQAVRRAINVISMLAVVSACTTSSLMPGADPLPRDGDRATAKLNARSVGTEWLCVDHRRHPLVADANGYALLPAGARVTIGSDAARTLSRAGGHACIASASFVPKAGQSYFPRLRDRGRPLRGVRLPRGADEPHRPRPRVDARAGRRLHRRLNAVPAPAGARPYTTGFLHALPRA
jgi:hypothetical protein